MASTLGLFVRISCHISQQRNLHANLMNTKQNVRRESAILGSRLLQRPWKRQTYIIIFMERVKSKRKFIQRRQQRCYELMIFYVWLRGRIERESEWARARRKCGIVCANRVMLFSFSYSHDEMFGGVNGAPSGVCSTSTIHYSMGKEWAAHQM